MKVLSLTQPWASLVILGSKKVETRSWRPRAEMQGQRILIHAAKGFPRWAKETCMEPIFQTGLGWKTDADVSKTLDFGVILGSVLLVECLPTESVRCLPGVFDDYPELDTEQERAFGDYSPGRFGWVLAEPIAFDAPIPAKGKLGLWDFDFGDVRGEA